MKHLYRNIRLSKHTFDPALLLVAAVLFAVGAFFFSQGMSLRAVNQGFADVLVASIAFGFCTIAVALAALGGPDDRHTMP